MIQRLFTSENRSLAARSALVIMLLAGTLMVQRALEASFLRDTTQAQLGLVEPLATLPTTMGAWTSQPVTIPPDALFADEHLYRRYTHAESGQQIFLWSVYSSSGADRRHHPEVCMEVAGKRENISARRALEVPPHEAPIVRYQFEGADGTVTSYYWFYTLRANQADALGEGIARLYHRARVQQPSVTFEVFAPVVEATGRERADHFVHELDATLQTLLPTASKRGSHRLPVSLLRQ